MPISIWKVSTKLDDDYFETLELVRQSIAITYSQWPVKPTIEAQREDYVTWRAADGALIEAYKITAKSEPDHL